MSSKKTQITTYVPAAIPSLGPRKTNKATSKAEHSRCDMQSLDSFTTKHISDSTRYEWITDTRPYVELIIRGKTLKTLVDTGAIKSLLGAKAYTQIMTPEGMFKLGPEQDLQMALGRHWRK